ncbi:phage virion morphogenesis protein [Undibacterium sp. NL8W]|uniref:Phage virion morphogenesis protein n=2 Tax=Undibacterium umbellatum TaxID=2762300 RepID=A0ABR6ZAT0_9BURK|nr:phage virion morphogenesis protein [Undibacterium umbellatum]
MFNKLRTNTHLKAKADGNGLEVGFYSHVARIARVHQYGLRDRIVAIGGEVIYANRYLLTPEQVESDLITKIFKDF